MRHQYYYKRLQLFKIPYRILLAYHNPAGNTIKAWSSYYMVSHIVAIRNDVQLLNMTHTSIQIRKALNALFERLRYRGSLLIYAHAYKALKLNHGSVFTFVTEWLPGLISNYKRVIVSLQANKKYLAKIYPYLKRPQLEAISNIKYMPVPHASFLSRKKRVARIPPVPSISLSILDSYIWLNECHCTGIPSIQICDTQSPFEKVTYPIISNQRSVPFSYFMVHLCAEVSNVALLYQRLYFISFYKYLTHRHYSKKKAILRKHIKHKIFEQDRRGYRHLIKIKTHRRRWLKGTSYFPIFRRRRHYYKKERYPSLNPRKYLIKKAKNSFIVNKQTYFFNKRLFAYQIKDLINTPTNLIVNPYQRLYDIIHQRLWMTFLSLRYILRRLFERRQQMRKRHFNWRYYRFRKTCRKIIKLIIVNSLGLRKALSRKYRRKRSTLIFIPFNKHDISGLIVCSYLYKCTAQLSANNNHLSKF